MRDIRLLFELLIAMSFVIFTQLGVSQAQPAGAGNLPPDVKALLEELQKSGGGFSGPLNVQGRTTGAPSEEKSSERLMSGYEEAMKW